MPRRETFRAARNCRSPSLGFRALEQIPTCDNGGEIRLAVELALSKGVAAFCLGFSNPFWRSRQRAGAHAKCDRPEFQHQGQCRLQVVHVGGFRSGPSNVSTTSCTFRLNVRSFACSADPVTWNLSCARRGSLLHLTARDGMQDLPECAKILLVSMRRRGRRTGCRAC